MSICAYSVCGSVASSVNELGANKICTPDPRLSEVSISTGSFRSYCYTATVVLLLLLMLLVLLLPVSLLATAKIIFRYANPSCGEVTLFFFSPVKRFETTVKYKTVGPAESCTIRSFSQKN